MLEADAVPMLVSLLGAHAKAADLLCILAKEQQCKEAFLEQAALQSLVTCLQGDVSGMGTKKETISFLQLEVPALKLHTRTACCICSDAAIMMYEGACHVVTVHYCLALCELPCCHVTERTTIDIHTIYSVNV